MVSKEAQLIRDNFSKGFEIIPPSTVQHPFLFSSPHSGRIYPAAFLAASPLSLAEIRSSEDAYIDELFAHVTDQGAHLIKALFPRAYLDLNRQAFELDPQLFADQLPAFAVTDSLRVKSGLGVIARLVSEGRQIYRAPLHVNDALERIKRLYYPYHGALRGQINELKRQAGYAVLVDCHSMPSKNIPGFKANPPDFVIGERFGKSCDPRLVALVGEGLRGLGYTVSLNKPYAGGYVTREYGRPHEGVHALQLEINRRLYLDEKTLVKTQGFKRLRDDLQDLTKKLITGLPDLSRQSPIAAE